MNCRNDIRELVVWTAGTELDADERREVERHVADCPECRELMSFAGELEQAARGPAHPGAETLVQWVEDPTSLAADEWTRVAEHVETCPTCTTETVILRQVEADAAAVTAAPDAATVSAEPTSVASEPRARVGGRSTADGMFVDHLRRWFESLLANPVPATAVLGVAMVTVALVARGPERGGDGFVTGPTLLSDTRAALRGGSAATPTIIEAGTSPLLLLELTDLAAPPADDEVFRVELGGGDTLDGTPPVWQREALGRDFADTYTLVVRLPADVLVPGEHRLSVLAPDGRTVFEAAIAVRPRTSRAGGSGHP